MSPPPPSSAPAEQTPRAPVEGWDDLPNAFRIPGTDGWIHVGGFARLDAIFDFLPIGSRGNFAISTIPLDGSTGQSLYFQVATSRLRLDFAHPTPLGRARATIEIDFFTDNGAPRIRHAYAEVGPVLAGQTWTTFMEAATLPPTLDFETPSGMVVSRQLMVRYTQQVTDQLQLALAAELPTRVINSDAQRIVPGSFDALAPDGVLKLRFEGGPLLAHAAFVVRYLRYRPDNGDDFGAAGYGGALSLRIKVLEWLTLWAELVGGVGVGGFRGAPDLSLDLTNQLVALPVVGVTGGLTVDWAEWLRSTAVFSSVGATSQQSTAFSYGDYGVYAAVNLQWMPIDCVMAGIEVLYGRRAGRLVGATPAAGDAVRLEGSLRVSLP